MTVWLKIALLLIYLSVLFILARMLEAIAWYEQGQLSVRLLDPMALSVLKLKALLEQRGVAYDSIVEKSELAELVESTGITTEGEVESVTDGGEETTSSITDFRGDLHFYEQVEDAKDSMWLVEILTEQGGLLSDTSWQMIQQKLGRFGIRFGRFDCQQDKLKRRFCYRKQWYHTQLVLALPETNTSKANVALHTYSGPVRVNSLFDWIKVKVNAKTTQIKDIETYRNNWEACPSTFKPEVSVVFVSTLSSIPLFLSALGVRFPGRVKIGNIDTSEKQGKTIAKRLKLNTKPSYLVLTCDQTYRYSLGHREKLTYPTMELFLKTLFPNMNDLFIVSVVLTNIACSFELILVGGTIVRRIVRLSLCIFQNNLIVILIWVLLLAVIQISLFEQIFMAMLRGLQFVTSSWFVSLLRADFMYYQSHIYIPVIVLGSLLYLVYAYRKKFMPETNSNDDSDWWNFSSLRTLDYEQWWELTRLRPFDQIFNPTMGILSVGGEPLNVPQSSVSKEYIQHLPSWVYKGDLSFVTKDEETKVPTTEVGSTSLATDSSTSSITDSSNISSTTKKSTDDVNELAESVLDSNYQCECDQRCLCTNDLRNPSVEDSPTSGSHHGNPSIGPEEAVLDTGTTDLDSPRVAPTSTTAAGCLPGPLFGCPVGYIECSQCCICLDSYKPFVLLRGLPCGHTFHDRCILTWLLRENHICPVCRWPAYKPKTAIYWDSHSE